MGHVVLLGAEARSVRRQVVRSTGRCAPHQGPRTEAPHSPPPSDTPVRERQRNPGCGESAQRIRTRVTARDESAQRLVACRAFATRVSDSESPSRHPKCDHPMNRVKNSLPIHAQTCTAGHLRAISVLITWAVDWLRATPPCFDPLHRGGHGRFPLPGYRTPPARPIICPQRGPLPLCACQQEGKFHHELHPPG